MQQPAPGTDHLNTPRLITNQATAYQVNALGQRIRKTNSSADTVFHYDTRGKLIAESDPGGGVKRELIYLGDIPVGVAQ